MSVFNQQNVLKPLNIEKNTNCELKYTCVCVLRGHTHITSYRGGGGLAKYDVIFIFQDFHSHLWKLDVTPKARKKKSQNYPCKSPPQVPESH